MACINDLLCTVCWSHINLSELSFPSWTIASHCIYGRGSRVGPDMPSPWPPSRSLQGARTACGPTSLFMTTDTTGGSGPSLVGRGSRSSLWRPSWQHLAGPGPAHVAACACYYRPHGLVCCRQRRAQVAETAWEMSRLVAALHVRASPAPALDFALGERQGRDAKGFIWNLRAVMRGFSEPIHKWPEKFSLR